MIAASPASAAPSWRHTVPAGGRLAVAVLAFLYGVGAATIAARHGASTTYAGRSDLAEVAELATGWALVSAGGLVLARPDWRRTGSVVTAAGFAWFAGDWAGWEGGPDAVRSIGFLAGGLVFALLFDAVASWTTRQRADRIVRYLVAAVYAETVVVLAGRALLRDPFDDPRCWSDCTSTNVFLAHSDRWPARALEFFDVRFAIAAGVALALLAAWRMARAAAPGRRRLWPVLVPGAAFGLLHAGWGVALLGGGIEAPAAGRFSILFGGRCIAAIALAVGLAWTLVRARATRRAVARLVEQLGEAPAPGSLESAMAQAVGDPSLTVAYWLPASQSYVDREGHPVDVGPVRGRATTTLVRGAEPVAIVMHDPLALDGAGLLREIGAAARLAVDNERLGAAARAQLAELTASRGRIVATADAERRRLERDLHDGAQQQLLALSYELRVARATAETAGNHELAGELEAAVREADSALDELRELAHGIYPAVLEESGIAPALQTLAIRAPLAVELGELTPERMPAAIERAAYVTVAEAISDAAVRGATFVHVDVQRRAGRLHVAARDDGTARIPELTHVADRLGALEGDLDLGPASVVAEIPCG